MIRLVYGSGEPTKMEYGGRMTDDVAFAGEFQPFFSRL